MKISQGISEISLSHPANIRPGKAYLWPVYDAGKVDPIFRVSRELDGKIFYSKPAPSERDRLLQSDHTVYDNSYSSQGTRRKISAFLPGTFFDAYV
jgi:hypothetical protein